MDAKIVDLRLKKSMSRKQDSTKHLLEAILPNEIQGTQLHVAGGEIPQTGEGDRIMIKDRLNDSSDESDNTLGPRIIDKNAGKIENMNRTLGMYDPT